METIYRVKDKLFKSLPLAILYGKRTNYAIIHIDLDTTEYLSVTSKQDSVDVFLQDEYNNEIEEVSYDYDLVDGEPIIKNVTIDEFPIKEIGFSDELIEEIHNEINYVLNEKYGGDYYEYSDPITL